MPEAGDDKLEKGNQSDDQFAGAKALRTELDLDKQVQDEAEAYDMAKAGDRDRSEMAWLNQELDFNLSLLQDAKELALWGLEYKKSHNIGDQKSWIDLYTSTEGQELEDKIQHKRQGKPKLERPFGLTREYSDPDSWRPLASAFRPFGQLGPELVQELHEEHPEVEVESPEFVELVFQELSDRERENFAKQIKRVEGYANSREDWAKYIHRHPEAVDVIRSLPFVGRPESPVETAAMAEGVAQQYLERAASLRDKASLLMDAPYSAAALSDISISFKAQEKVADLLKDDETTLGQVKHVYVDGLNAQAERLEKNAKQITETLESLKA